MKHTDTIPYDYTDTRDKEHLDGLVREYLCTRLGLVNATLPHDYGYTITVNWESCDG